jgi:hypothetical protein
MLPRVQGHGFGVLDASGECWAGQFRQASRWLACEHGRQSPSALPSARLQQTPASQGPQRRVMPRRLMHRLVRQPACMTYPASPQMP